MGDSGDSVAARCQSILGDGESRCPAKATVVVKGRPGYDWSGIHCGFHASIVSKHYDHQGGCVVMPMNAQTDGEWWLCPNEPRCPHGAVLHDFEDMEDDHPRCCVEGCDCGRQAAESDVFCDLPDGTRTVHEALTLGDIKATGG